MGKEAHCVPNAVIECKTCRVPVERVITFAPHEIRSLVGVSDPE